MKRRKPISSLPVRPVTDTEAACRLLAKQFAWRRDAWLKHLELAPPAGTQLTDARAQQQRNA